MRIDYSPPIVEQHSTSSARIGIADIRGQFERPVCSSRQIGVAEVSFTLGHIQDFSLEMKFLPPPLGDCRGRLRSGFVMLHGKYFIMAENFRAHWIRKRRA
jgi:hypothetical protein